MKHKYSHISAIQIYPGQVISFNSNFVDPRHTKHLCLGLPQLGLVLLVSPLCLSLTTPCFTWLLLPQLVLVPLVSSVCLSLAHPFFRGWVAGFSRPLRHACGIIWGFSFSGLRSRLRHQVNYYIGTRK